MAFLDAGVHVLMEKPLAATAAEADQLVEPPAAAPGPSGRPRGAVQSGFTAAAAARCAIRRYIEAVRAGGFSFRSTDVGVVLDLMIHDMDLVLSLVRSPRPEGRGPGLSVLGGHEDVANARLEFQSGCVAALSPPG